MERIKKIPAVFYRTPAGAEPVRLWLKGLDAEDRKIIGADVATVEYGWPVGMPTCRPLAKGLWEVRSNLKNNRIARVLFGIVRNQMGSLAWLHKEDSEDAARRLEACS